MVRVKGKTKGKIIIYYNICIDYEIPIHFTDIYIAKII